MEIEHAALREDIARALSVCVELGAPFQRATNNCKHVSTKLGIVYEVKKI